MTSGGVPPKPAQTTTPKSHTASPPSKRDLKSWWKTFKLASKHQDTNEPHPQGIFGVPLRQSITYANVAISLLDDNGKSYIYGYVPIVVAKCGVYLKEKATGIEGIFRLSGSEKRIKELKTIFDSPDRYGKGLVWDGYTVHDAANVLRRYLNDLPEPVVPLDCYEMFREPLKGATRQGLADAEGPQFNEDFDMDAAITKYQELIKGIPPLHRQLLLYILDLLAVFAAKSDENRMTSQNLAAIFQPGMLSHPTHAMAPEEYRLNQCVIIFLIENQDHFLVGMEGTATDAKTVQQFEKGTPPIITPATPPPMGQRSGLVRSASNASAGAESVARDGRLRRNRSTASRRSRMSGISGRSGGAQSPSGSPALATTPTGGLARSNTVPSKKSPALSSAKFQPSPNAPGAHAPVAPLTPVNITEVPASPPTNVEVTSPHRSPAPSSIAPASFGAGTLLPGQPSTAGRSQERLLDPNADAATPGRERSLPSLFQRSPGDGEKRQPNKLRKKRMPGSANPSAQSSTTSLTRAITPAISPSVEALNAVELPGAAVRENGASDAARPVPTENPAELTPRASQTPGSDPALAAGAGETTLKPTKSPPTSLHSSFNENSDMDQFDENAAVASSGEQSELDKERKRRWRFSRRRDETGAPMSGPLSPRRDAGPMANADMSTTSFGSSVRPRKSFSGETEPPLAPAEVVSSHDSSSREKDDPRGLTGWIKHKYREHKESAEQRRNKSPPADRPSGVSSFLPTRGKSIDIKRPEEKELDNEKKEPLSPARVPATTATQVPQPTPEAAQPAPQADQAAPQAVQPAPSSAQPVSQAAQPTSQASQTDEAVEVPPQAAPEVESTPQTTAEAATAAEPTQPGPEVEAAPQPEPVAQEPQPAQEVQTSETIESEGPNEKTQSSPVAVDEAEAGETRESTS